MEGRSGTEEGMEERWSAARVRKGSWHCGCMEMGWESWRNGTDGAGEEAEWKGML